MCRMAWVALAGLLLGGAASAQTLGELPPDFRAANFTNYDGTLSLDKFRGRIVIIVSWQTTDAVSAEVATLLNDIHDRYSKRGVTIIAVTAEKRDQAEGFVKGKECKFIVAYEFDTENKWAFSQPPEAYLLDTQGRVARSRFHAQDGLEDKLKGQMEKTPPAGADSASVRNRFAAAKKAFDAKTYGKAWTLIKDVVDAAEGDLGTQAKELQKKIEEEARKKLDETTSLIDRKEWDAAAKIIADIQVRFDGHKLADDAQLATARIQGDRTGKTAMTKALNNARGELLLDQAADYEASKQYLEALTVLRDLTTKYPDSDAAKSGKEIMERFKGDPTIQEIIKRLRATEEADRWYDIAERLERLEMYDMARGYYQRIVDTHGTTKAATKAKTRLKEMPKDAPSSSAPAAK